MSKIILTPNASGTGNFTIQSPNSDTNRTFTLPDADGELSVGKAFSYDSVSGATQDLDLDDGNFFDGGTLSADTTLTFSNLPTEAKWAYTAIADTFSGYALADASYDSVSFNVSSQSAYPNSIFFKPDGTKMYVNDAFNTDIYQYSLSTAWDVSTASYDSVTTDLTAQMTFVYGTYFKPDGTKMYVVANINTGGNYDRKVYQYSLSTAWDLSTISYDSKNITLPASGHQGIFFKDDGTRMFVVDQGANKVSEYTLSTAWDVSTASINVSFDLSSQVTSAAEGIFFKPDGTVMFVISSTDDAVFQYDLSTAWSLSSASYSAISFDVSSQDTTALSVSFKSDGAKMYVGGGTNDAIFQYSTGGGVTITLPASVQNPPTLASDPNQRLTYDFYTADGGTNVYLIGEEIS